MFSFKVVPLDIARNKASDKKGNKAFSITAFTVLGALCQQATAIWEE